MNYIHKSVPESAVGIHISDVRAFNACRLRWYFSSRLKRNLQPLHTNPVFWTGTGVHEAIERWHKSPGFGIRDCYQQWLDTQEELIKADHNLRGKLQEYVSISVHMAEAYEKWYRENMSHLLKFSEFEVPFRVPLVTPGGNVLQNVCLEGRIDALARYRQQVDNEASNWIVEFKTTSSAERFSRSLTRDNQCRAYLYAMRWFMPIDGIYYILIEKRSLKVYTIQIQVTQEEMSRYTADLCTVSQNMANNPDIWPSPSETNCDYCQYQSPCDIRSAGLDYESALAEEYAPYISATDLLTSE